MITEEEFLKYERVRKSGITNMLNITKVMIIAGLARHKCVEIMESYSELKDKYLNAKSDNS